MIYIRHVVLVKLCRVLLATTVLLCAACAGKAPPKSSETESEPFVSSLPVYEAYTGTPSGGDMLHTFDFDISNRFVVEEGLPKTRSVTVGERVLTSEYHATAYSPWGDIKIYDYRFQSEDGDDDVLIYLDFREDWSVVSISTIPGLRLGARPKRSVEEMRLDAERMFGEVFEFSKYRNFSWEEGETRDGKVITYDLKWYNEISGCDSGSLSMSVNIKDYTVQSVRERCGSEGAPENLVIDHTRAAELLEAKLKEMFCPQFNLNYISYHLQFSPVLVQYRGDWYVYYGSIGVTAEKTVSATQSYPYYDAVTLMIPVSVLSVTEDSQ